VALVVTIPVTPFVELVKHLSAPSVSFELRVLNVQVPNKAVAVSFTYGSQSFNCSIPVLLDGEGRIIVFL
jgi:hypothetical protein